MAKTSAQLQNIFLQLLPTDHTPVGTASLLTQFLAAAQAAGIRKATEEDFSEAREILVAVSKRQKDKKSATSCFQPGLFGAPFESMPFRTAVDFYKHDRGWANRLVAKITAISARNLIGLAA